LEKSDKRNRKQLSAIRPFVFNGEVPFEPGVWHRLQDRNEIYSKSDNPIERANVLITQPTVEGNEAIEPITDFIELPIWQISRNRLSFLIDDVLRISEVKFVAGLLIFKPDEDLTPSSSDWATFTYLDALLGRPLLYMIMGPDKNRKPLIIHFEPCHKCPNSFHKLFEEIRKKGGENNGTHQSMV
jgi:hypothetical protein